MYSWVGIDVAKASFQVCLLQEKPLHVQFDNTVKGYKGLQGWLKRHAGKEVWIGMEATGSYGEALCEYVHGQGYRVSVVNPARIKGYAQSQMKRHKTDQSDAALIADFCRTQQPALWTPPSGEERELRDLVRRLDDLKQLRQAEQNRLEARPTSPVVLRDLQQVIAFLDQQIRQLEQDIDDHIQQHPRLRQQRALLTSIPGLGNLTSSQIMAELGDLTRFDNVRQLVALAGLNPQQRQSGSSLHYTAGISRMGRFSLRAALYMPALVAIRHNPILRVFAQRLTDNGLTAKQVIVAVMRKLLHLAYGILKSKRPFNPHHRATLAACS
jgi:transposase